eukprot:CAMPEP_0168379928 /NCGR_PEP_ID=MMETSP0228-20121227/12096_1 /TAXON_ID=133427 /ORGANISM="Protoceratium reticulatum, Strain CCCM 535 (=CCMP 1889)" /LENGTH=182 /DNA_ID=CAMNT_0008392975 /DNA_START=66 /DNA_END=611 /DNA_ORIENTATION=-
MMLPGVPALVIGLFPMLTWGDRVGEDEGLDNSSVDWHAASHMSMFEAMSFFDAKMEEAKHLAEADMTPDDEFKLLVDNATKKFKDKVISNGATFKPQKKDVFLCVNVDVTLAPGISANIGVGGTITYKKGCWTSQLEVNMGINFHVGIDGLKAEIGVGVTGTVSMAEVPLTTVAVELQDEMP